MLFGILEPFRPYIAQAVVRLRYLYPGLSVSITGEGVEVDGIDSETDVAKELNYLLYREKIYAETLSMRRDLIAAVTRR